MIKIIIAVLLIALVIFVLKKVAADAQEAGNNSTGSTAGSPRRLDISGTDKAYQLVADNAKGQWVPKWIAEDAILMLQDYYSPTDAAQQIYNFMKARSLYIADFPRSTYLAPDTATDTVVDYCMQCISDLECIRRRLPEELPEPDIDSLCQLAFVIYFADRETTTYEQAQLTVMDMLSDYKKHVGILPE